MRIDIGSFELESYNDSKETHFNAIVKINSDEASKKYLGDLFYKIKRTDMRHQENFIDEFYIVYRKDKIIGIIALNELDEDIIKSNNCDPKYSVSIGLMPEYRGENLGLVLLSQFVDYVFSNYPNIQELYGEIDSTNTASIKNANTVGFVSLGQSGKSDTYVVHR